MTRKVKISTIVIMGFFTISLLVLAFLFLNKQLVFGYVCPIGTTCMAEGSVNAGNYLPGCEVYDRPYNCISYGCVESYARIPFSCSGTNSDCTGSSGAYYSSYDDCINRANPLYSRCCNSGGSSGGGETCGCGTQECESYDCECTYIGCKRISDPEENCYEYRCDSTPPCVDCNVGDCPSPLTNSGSDDYKLSNYRFCMKGGSCAGMKYDDCYENPNAIPTSTINVNRNPSDITPLGCQSSSYTGRDINNPINMNAVFTDANGASDIEAIYVWLKTQAPIPNTPEYIDSTANPNTARTFTNNSWGFMMHKEGTSWVPYLVNRDTAWVRASYSNNRFAIKGPSSADMVFVEIRSITPNGNNITLNFDFDFNGIADANKVVDGNYNLFTMVNDVFGFTPIDNYPPTVTNIGNYFDPGQIRFYNRWTDSGRDWSIDFTDPEFNSQVSAVTGSSTNITFSWADVRDLVGLYGISGNVYLSEGVQEAQQIDITSFESSSGSKTVTATPFIPQVQPANGDDIGKIIDGEYTVRAINIGSTTASGSVSMNVGANREGSLIYYATAFDLACNIGQSNTVLNLEDWIVTYGGLVYSSGGIDFPVQDVAEPDTWDPVDLLNKLSPLYADISSEMYGDSSGSPSSLTKSFATKSFSISPFKEYKVEDYYNDVRNTFERREIGIANVQRMPDTGLLVGNLGGGSIKVLDRIGNLTVGNASPFTCDGKGIFFVSGNLTIENEILNNNYNHDACIFVVKGNVIINSGPNSSGAAIGYDEINAYILTNGTVTINQDPSLDGLYISGGIQSRGGINTINRYLGLNYRNTHPVIVVNHHSKYGIFTSTLIGNPVDMVKIEVGFKPY